MSIPKFDPSLGTLTGIHFELNGQALGDVMFESLDPETTTVTTKLQAQITLYRPDMSIIVVTIPLANNVDHVTSFDGIIDFGGTSGKSYLGITGSSTDTADSPPPASDLVLFTGLGTIVLPIQAAGTSMGSGAGNLITQFHTSAAASATVTYTYDLPPEGACCDHVTGNCTITTQAACGFDWLGAGVPCNVTTCVPPTPTENSTWGVIKNRYR